MAINSRTKGKRGELEAVQLLKDHGFEARRGQQFKGGPDSPDIIHDAGGVHFEVKRTERLNVYDALEQAAADAGEGEHPVVLHRRNGKPWVLVMYADHFLDSKYFD